MKQVAALFFFIVVSLGIHAQCKDTVNIQPGAFCPPLYSPVCGCDGKTYMNDCVAHTQNGVLQYNSGPCGGIDFIITPSPVIDVLYLKAMINKDSYIRLQVIDRFGRVYYSNIIQGVLGGYLFETSIEIPEVPTEYCYLYAETEEGYKVKPFVKFRHQ